ncbi:MAG: hypothetical protein P4L91_06790 [Burkholderiaceae bacterium]|nr:hypothetical protein [Burkholderiaceae bacterium]
MTIPANLIAGLLASSASHPISLSITAPLSGSTIANNTTAEAIAGVASSIAGNITALQYQIDGGSWNNFTFTAAASVSYSGGNAGQIGAGGHTVAVKATDAAANTLTVSSSYSITGSPPAPAYSWTPYYTYNGQNNYLTITHATANATVAYTQTQLDAHGNAVATLGMTTLGTTDVNGNFSHTGVASWTAGAWTDSVQLYVGGVQVGAYSFVNSSNNLYATPSYTPNTAPNGTQITLNFAGSWASSTVTQTMTFSPSGTVVGPTVLGFTDANGNFSSSQTMTWGTDTSCSIQVSLSGVSQGTYTFIP